MMDEVFLIARLIIGGVWVYAGISKIWHRTSLARTLEGFGIQNPSLIYGVDKLAPWFELALGAGLISGFFSWAFGSVSLLLLLAFTGLFIRVIHSGVSLRCNCFGGHSEAISVFDIVRNLYFASLSVMAIFSQNSFQKWDYRFLLGAIPLFVIPFLLFFQTKLLADIGRNIKKSENEVFDNYYGSSALMSLARWFRVEGS